MCSLYDVKSLKGPSASESGDSEISFLFFSGKLTVSLVTVHLAALRFFFFFISILGEVVTVDEEGLAVTVPGVEPSPFNKFSPVTRVNRHSSWLEEKARWLNPWRAGCCWQVSCKAVAHLVKRFLVSP